MEQERRSTGEWAGDAELDELIVILSEAPDDTEVLSLDAMTAPLAVPADGDHLVDELGEYTEDVSIIEDFVDRQALAFSGHDLLIERLENVNDDGLVLAAGDIDANWAGVDTGEEFVGGTTPTPDQDQVDALGQAAGLVYQDDEILRTGDILAQRDANRAELDPEFAQDDEEEAA